MGKNAANLATEFTSADQYFTAHRGGLLAEFTPLLGSATLLAVLRSNLNAASQRGTFIENRVVSESVSSMKGLLMSQRMQHCLAGGIAGLLATVPMTAMMIVGKHLLPQRSQGPLPPVQITRNALRAAGVDDEVSREEEVALSAVNHFGFGAGTGALYGLLGPPHSPVDAVTSGCIYGLGVWSCSYLGWLPAVGLYRSAVKDTPERNTLMIMAHLVWGAGLGLATCWLSETERGRTNRKT